jgi:hypothetical protein
MSELEEEVEAPYWAAMVDIPVIDEGEQVGSERRLFVVQAVDALDARRESGLVDAHFHEATDEEMVQWDRLTATGFTQEDVGRLLTLVRREIVHVSNKEARATGFGKSRGHRFRVLDRYKAASLVTLRGKLELLAGELEESKSTCAQCGEWLDSRGDCGNGCTLRGELVKVESTE